MQDPPCLLGKTHQLLTLALVLKLQVRRLVELDFRFPLALHRLAVLLDVDRLTAIQYVGGVRVGPDADILAQTRASEAALKEEVER